MANGNRSSRRRREGGRRRSRENRGEAGEGEIQKPDIPLPQCPFCGKPIRDIYSAIAGRETGEPSHFDCILKDIRDQEPLQADEKVCYLGKGSFGIIQNRSGGGSPRFTIRKRIQYEANDREYPWRKQLSRPAERHREG